MTVTPIGDDFAGMSEKTSGKTKKRKRRKKSDLDDTKPDITPIEPMKAPTPMPPVDPLPPPMAAKITRASKPEDFGIVMVEEPAKNRMCLAFEPAANPEEMYLLKVHGFRWSPPFCVWMRRSGPKATYAIQKLIPELVRIRSL